MNVELNASWAEWPLMTSISLLLFHPDLDWLSPDSRCRSEDNEELAGSHFSRIVVESAIGCHSRILKLEIWLDQTPQRSSVTGVSSHEMVDLALYLSWAQFFGIAGSLRTHVSRTRAAPPPLGVRDALFSHSHRDETAPCRVAPRGDADGTLLHRCHAYPNPLGVPRRNRRHDLRGRCEWATTSLGRGSRIRQPPGSGLVSPRNTCARDAKVQVGECWVHSTWRAIQDGILSTETKMNDDECQSDEWHPVGLAGCSSRRSSLRTADDSTVRIHTSVRRYSTLLPQRGWIAIRTKQVIVPVAYVGSPVPSSG